jgi:hypothetical protein
MGVFGKIVPQILSSISNSYTKVKDLFVHALFARVAMNDGRTIEFQTKYDPNTDTIELHIPDDILPVFDEILGMQRGPNFQCYINWLIGKQQIIDDVPSVIVGFDTDQQFVPVGSLTIWTGAAIENTNNVISISLPTVAHSVLGYNMKLSSALAGNSIKVSLVWKFDAGNNTSFNIKTNVISTDFDGTIVASDSNDVSISTFNLINGDIRTTELITTSGINPDEMVNITLQRNYDGNTDPHTESINLIGLKIEVL